MERPTRTNYKSDMTLMLLDGKYVEKLEKYCTQLEKALDKACELLEKFQTEDAISNDIFGKIEIISKEKWKNYLLKESEKQ